MISTATIELAPCAQCRAKKDHGDSSMSSSVMIDDSNKSRLDRDATASHSVTRAVASLIRSIEDSRYTAADRPHDLAIREEDPQSPRALLSPRDSDFLTPQDAGTQTTPFSASRSSSFDWINEPTEDGLRDLTTPLSTPRSEFGFRPLSLKLESSSETDEADREVAQIADRTEARERTEKQRDSERVLREKRAQTETRDGEQMKYAQMDEGLALLLEYGEPSAIRLQQEIEKQQKLKRESSVKDNSDSLPTKLRPSIGRRTGSGPLLDSIYDNMPGQRNRIVAPGQFSPLVLQRTLAAPSLSQTSTVSAPRSPALNSIRSGTSTNSMNLSSGSGNGAVGLPIVEDEESEKTKIDSIALQLAERDAEESCEWLKQAGFPQYVRQFQEGKPIDLQSAQRDHEFLSTDLLRALYRRLDALNRCAIMKVDNVVMRRRNDDYNVYNGYDDDDHVALSHNWQYQRQSQNWSHVPHNEPIFGVHGRTVSTKPNWTGSMHRHADRQVSRTDWYEARDPRPNDQFPGGCSNEPSAATTKLQRSQSERIRERARAFMKKMDLRSNSRRRKESRQRDPLVIGEPQLLSYDSASPEAMRMMQSARPNNLQARGRQYHPPTVEPRSQPRSKSARRQGMVMLTPSSPESSSADDSFLSMTTADSSTSSRRRDCSMPPVSRLHYDTHSGVPPRGGHFENPRMLRQHTFDCDGSSSRRTRNPFDAFLYPGSPASLTRSTVTSRNGIPSVSRLPPQRPQLYDFYSTPTVPAKDYDSYSPGTYRIPTQQTVVKKPNFDENGYFFRHGEQISPADLRLGRNDSPSTSHSSHLKVDTHKSESSVEHTDEEQSTLHRRRDSGVGSSLSRSPSGPSAQRIRQSMLQYSAALSASLLSTTSNGSWQNTKKRNPNNNNNNNMTASLASSTSTDESFFTDVEMARCFDSLSIIELTRMRKLAYLRVTAQLEKSMGAGAMKLNGDLNGENTAGNKNWSVQRLIKKMKISDGKTPKESDENGVFGVSLEMIYKKSGLSLPRSIVEVLRYLRQMAPDTVGIFRKNGVKSRIAELRAVCDRDVDVDVFIGDNRLDSGQVHDVADLLKQYLRDLPEPLMTTRLSETFANIFTYVPEVDRLSTLQFALLLLPDENREAVQTLLFFLHDVAKHSDVNNMTSQNLAVCFTPSLFQLSASRLDKIPATRRHKTIGAAGMPTEKEMKETRACQMCLTMMIDYARTIFMVPDTLDERPEFEDDVPALKALGLRGPRSFLIDRVVDMIKDHSERWKGWVVEGTWDGLEIASKKAIDSHPLKTFKVWVDVAAPPKEVMHRIMKEKALWDTSVVNWRTVESVSDDTDVHQYVINDTVGHATRDCYLVRFHSAGLTEIRGACAIAERSVQCAEPQLLGGLPATVLDQRFLVEPKSGHSRVTYIARVDLKGRSCAWYNKIYGTIMCRQMSRLRDSYHSVDDNGPETKV